jgi:hypothetical protein
MYRTGKLLVKKLGEVLDTDIPRSAFKPRSLEMLWKASCYRRAFAQDLKQFFQYGFGVPKFCETVFVDTRNINFWLPPTGDWWSESGRLLSGDWEQGIEPLSSNRTLTYARMHFQEGHDWLEIREKLLSEGSAGIPEFAVLENLVSKSESKRSESQRRLMSYEKLYSELSESRSLKARSELEVPHFREHGGILIHFDSMGRLIFGARGNHRFAISKLLELSIIPAMVGLVHPKVKDSWRDSTITT